MFPGLSGPGLKMGLGRPQGRILKCLWWRIRVGKGSTPEVGMVGKEDAGAVVDAEAGVGAEREADEDEDRVVVTEDLRLRLRNEKDRRA